MALVNASKNSVVTTMKFLTPALTRQETSSPPPVLMDALVSTMCSLVLALPSSRATRTKSVKFPSTPRVTRSSLRVATRRAEFGQLTLALNCKFSELRMAKVMKMKFSLAHSTTRVTPSLQDPKITPVVFGRTHAFSPRWKQPNSD